MILIVDDYTDGREMTAEYLRQSHFRVIEAATGRQAIEAAAVACPDLVLLDLVLPDLDGWEVIERLRASDRTKHILIAVHTASVTLTVRERARQYGADLFLPRPCDLVLLACQLAAAVASADVGPAGLSPKT